MWFFWDILGPWAKANYCRAVTKSPRGTVLEYDVGTHCFPDQQMLCFHNVKSPTGLDLHTFYEILGVNIYICVKGRPVDWYQFRHPHVSRILIRIPAMGTRNQVSIGLSYRPAILCSMAAQFQTRFLESIPRPIAGLKFPTWIKNSCRICTAVNAPLLFTRCFLNIAQ